MMKKHLLYLVALLMVPAMSLAQTSNWTFDRLILTPDSINFGGGVHGLAVDAEGKLWIAEWAPSGTTGKLHVYNEDGSLADFSPVTSVTFDGVEQTIARAAGNRGLRADHNGDILLSNGSNLYRLDHTTGEATAKFEFGTPLISVSATNDGEVAIAAVLPGNPISILDETLNPLVDVIDEIPEFRRTILISGDGNRVYEFSYTTGRVAIYESEIGVFGTYALVDSSSIVGVATEAAAWDPVTGYMWISAGSPGDRPNEYEIDGELVETNWTLNTWYALDPNDGYAVKDSVAWDGYDFELLPDIRPRAIAFSNDGNYMYLGMFNTAPVQVFRRNGTSVERNESEMAQGFELSQNFPNPFNPVTTINYTIPESDFVSLKVYDLMGREIATLVNGVQSAGQNSVTFNAEHLASGVYVYVLETGSVRLTNKMMLMK